MLDRLKKSLLYAVCFSAAYVLVGIPLGRYHVDKMALELLLNFAVAFIVCFIIYFLYLWISQKFKRKKQ